MDEKRTVVTLEEALDIRDAKREQARTLYNEKTTGPKIAADTPLTRRQKIRANRTARAEAYSKMTPEEQSAYNDKQRAKRAKRRSRPRKINKNSRSYRWSTAVGNAQDALTKMQSAADDVKAAMEEIAEIKQEFQEWLDNLDGKFAGSALVEKLETITQLETEWEPDFNDIEDAIGEAESAELPMGFGRD